MSVQISVPDEVKDLLASVQKTKGFDTLGEASQFVAQVFTSRYNALKNYAEKQKGGKPAKKKATKKAAKKAAKKAKAKGPIARKTKKAPVQEAQAAAQ